MKENELSEDETSETGAGSAEEDIEEDIIEVESADNADYNVEESSEGVSADRYEVEEPVSKQVDNQLEEE